jgi:hypothetical protein
MKKKPPRDTATLGSSEVSVATAESVSQVTSPSTPATPWFLSHAAVVLTIGSLSVSLLGAILQGVTCWTLGINFFDYAQPADFFMSFFRRPDGAFLVIFLLLFQLLVQLPSEWVHRNRARAIQLREETWWGRMAFHRQFFGYALREGVTLRRQRNLTLIVLAMTLITQLAFRAWGQANRILKGQGPRVVLHVGERVIGEDRDLALVTVTSQFVITYSTSKKQPEVWTWGAIRKLSYLPKVAAAEADHATESPPQ